MCPHTVHLIKGVFEMDYPRVFAPAASNDISSRPVEVFYHIPRNVMVYPDTSPLNRGKLVGFVLGEYTPPLQPPKGRKRRFGA